MSFRFSLGRGQVKQFKTALQTLNKIGGELLIEAVPEQLVLRSINTAKSAFISVTYFSRFFDSYEIYDTTVVQTIVLGKNALAIFRSQKLSQIEFALDSATARLQATVHTEEGLIKRYAFNCLDGEVLQATVDREAYPTVVIAEASELEKLLSSFQHTLDEITLIANPLSAAALANGHKACEMRSFVDPLKGGQESALLTSLTLDTRSVFTSYSHSPPLATDVTFNVKDFRAMTALCTALGADVALRLEAAGAPLVVEPHFRGLREGAETDFQAMLVLSTLTDSQLGPEHQQQQALDVEEGQQRQQPEASEQQPRLQAAEAAQPRTPHEGTGGPADYGAGRGGRGKGGRSSGAAATSATASAGRGRRRLPPRQDDSSAGAPAVARGAYAAAARAEGLPITYGDTTPVPDAPVPMPVPPGAALGNPGWPGLDGADIARDDGLEDNIPPRRTGRPPRYDPTNHVAFTAVPMASLGGGDRVADMSPLHQLQPAQQQQQPENVPEQRVGPTDPRAVGAAQGSAAAGAPAEAANHHHHQQQQQQHYVQFLRGPATTAGRCQGGDSQDPESLPGMRSPYGRQQGQAVALGRSPSFGSYSVADPRVARAAAGHLPPGSAQDDSRETRCDAEDHREAGVHGPYVPGGGHMGPAAPPHRMQYPQPADPSAIVRPEQPYLHPFTAGDSVGQQQHHQQQQQLVHELQQLKEVNHTELFGDDEMDGDDDGSGGGGGGDDEYYDIVDNDDEDEEVPATPPDQQQTRSMGAGVLGLGGGG